MPLDELATRLSVATAEVEGIERARRRRRGRQPRALQGRPRARGREAPERRPAADHEGRRRGGRAALDRLRRLELRRRRHRRRRASGRAAAERARARPPRGARPGLRRDDPGRGRGRPRRRPRRDHAAPRRPSRARRSPTSCRSSTTCSIVEATGNRPDLQSIYGLAREIATLYDLSLADRGRGQSPAPSRRDGRRSGSTTSRAARATSGACSRTSRSGPRRSGCGRASSSPGSGRSRTSSTSPTT